MTNINPKTIKIILINSLEPFALYTYICIYIYIHAREIEPANLCQISYVVKAPLSSPLIRCVLSSRYCESNQRDTSDLRRGNIYRPMEQCVWPRSRSLPPRWPNRRINRMDSLLNRASQVPLYEIPGL